MVFVKLLLQQVTFKRRHFKKIKSRRLVGRQLDCCCFRAPTVFPSHPGPQQHRDMARTLNTDVAPRSASSGLAGSSVELAHLGG